MSRATGAATRSRSTVSPRGRALAAACAFVLADAFVLTIGAPAASAMPVTREYRLLPPELAPPGPGPAPASILEDCGGFGIGCEVVVPSGIVRFTTDIMAGQASLDFSGVTIPVRTDGSEIVPLATTLLFDLESGMSTPLPSAALFDRWGFTVTPSDEPGISVLFVVDEFFSELRIGGGYDFSPVDGPRVTINLRGTLVPEPSTTLLLLGGLAGLAMRRPASIPDRR